MFVCVCVCSSLKLHDKCARERDMPCTERTRQMSLSSRNRFISAQATKVKRVDVNACRWCYDVTILDLRYAAERFSRISQLITLAVQLACKRTELAVASNNLICVCSGCKLIYSLSGMFPPDADRRQRTSGTGSPPTRHWNVTELPTTAVWFTGPRIKNGLTVN